MAEPSGPGLRRKALQKAKQRLGVRAGVHPDEVIAEAKRLLRRSGSEASDQSLRRTLEENE